MIEGLGEEISTLMAEIDGYVTRYFDIIKDGNDQESTELSKMIIISSQILNVLLDQRAAQRGTGRRS